MIADTLTTAQRSEQMRNIRGPDAGPEMTVRATCESKKNSKQWVGNIA